MVQAHATAKIEMENLAAVKKILVSIIPSLQLISAIQNGIAELRQFRNNN